MESFVNDELIDIEGHVRCGCIYLEESSRILKFACLLCEKAYNNVNQYCNHLNVHFYEEEICGAKISASANVKSGNENENNGETIEFGEVEVTEALSDDCDFIETDDEADLEGDAVNNRFEGYDYDSNAFARGEEWSNPNNFPLPSDNAEGADYFNDMNDVLSENDCVLEAVEFENETTDFENLIGNAKILKSFKTHSATSAKLVNSTRQQEPLRPMKNSKKIKIITINNRIDALYSMVKDASVEKRIAATVERTTNDVVTKIIGETVITTLPLSANATAAAAKCDRREEVKCLACNKLFRNQASLSTHSRTHYLETQNQIKVAHKCTECNELFSRLKDLQMHIHKVHYPNGVKCRLCNKTIRTISLLETHMKKMHIHRPFRCRLCGRANFGCIQGFEEHLRMHGNEEVFKCYLCGNEYTCEGNLKQHVLRHAKRIHQCCVVCGKKTQRLSQHMKIHSPRPTRLLQCPICNKTFSFSSALSRHKLMHKLPRTGRCKLVRKDNCSTTNRHRRFKRNVNETFTFVEKYDDVDKKKVIVELIENVAYRKSLSEENPEHMDNTVARYETISAMQSIASHKKELESSTK